VLLGHPPECFWCFWDTHYFGEVLSEVLSEEVLSDTHRSAAVLSAFEDSCWLRAPIIFGTPI